MGLGESLARSLVGLAARQLPPGCADWGQAMCVEYEEARQDGRGIPFALGCVLATVRAHLALPIDGFAACRAGLVSVTLLPVAIFHLGCSYGCFRFALGGADHFHAALLVGNAAQRHMAVAYAQAAPLQGALLIVLAGSQLTLAWRLVGLAPGRALAAINLGLAAAIALAVSILNIMADWNGVAVQFAGLGVGAILLVSFKVLAAGRQDAVEGVRQ